MNKSNKSLKHDTYKAMHNAHACYAMVRLRCNNAKINKHRKQDKFFRTNEIQCILNDIYSEDVAMTD